MLGATQGRRPVKRLSAETARRGRSTFGGARTHPARRRVLYTSLTSLNTRSFSPFRKWTMFSQLRRSKSSMAVVE